MAFVSNLRPAGQLNQPYRADGKPVALDQVHETVASRAVSMPAANRTFGKPCAKWPVAMQGDTGYSRQGGVLTSRIYANDWGLVAHSQPQSRRFDGELLLVSLTGR